MADRGRNKKQPEPSPVADAPKQRVIEEYRHCPLCWSGSGGYGTAYSTHGQTRYYKCDQSTQPGKGPCGHTWTAIVKLEVVKVEHRVVQIEGQR